MICNKCGANIPDNSKFCSVCGTEVDQIEEKNVVDKDQIVQISQPASIDDYEFQSGQTLSLPEQIKRIQIADDVIKQVFSYIESAKHNKEEAYKAYSGMPLPLLFVIILFISPVFVIVVAAALSSLLGGKFLSGLFFSAIVAAFVYGFLRYKKQKSLKWKNHTEQAKEDEQHVEEIIRQNSEAIAYVPKKYRFPLATGYMREMYETGRVQSMNEALDKYDEYEHRLKMETSQSAIYLQMQAQQKMIADTNAAATVGAAAGVINFLIHL